jgi:hypothetical protein
MIGLLTELGNRVRREEAASTRLRVASHDTALAPFSQNSAVWRCPESGSGQAQLGQSNPVTWFIRSSVCRLRLGPISVSA